MRARAYAVVGLLALLGATTSSAQGPWTVTITLTDNPLPIGTCKSVLLRAFDPIRKGTPRTEAGHYLSSADFDMGVEGAAVGKFESATIYLVCGCQSATIGAQGMITATYPAKLLAEKLRVADVAFTTKTPFTFS